MESFSIDFRNLTDNRQLQLSIQLDDGRYLRAPFDETFGNLMIKCGNTPAINQEEFPKGCISRRDSKTLVRKLHQASASAKVFQKCLETPFRNSQPLIKWTYIAALRSQNQEWLERTQPLLGDLSSKDRIQIAEEAAVLGWVSLKKLKGVSIMEQLQGILRAGRRVETLQLFRKTLPELEKADLILLAQQACGLNQLKALEMLLSQIRSLHGFELPKGDLESTVQRQALVRSLNRMNPKQYLEKISLERLCVNLILGLDIQPLLEICYWLNPDQPGPVNFVMLLESFPGEKLIRELLEKIPKAADYLAAAAAEIGNSLTFELLVEEIHSPLEVAQSIHHRAPMEVKLLFLHLLRQKFEITSKQYLDALDTQDPELISWYVCVQNQDPQQIVKEAIKLQNSQILGVAQSLGVNVEEASQELSPEVAPIDETPMAPQKSFSELPEIPWADL